MYKRTTSICPNCNISISLSNLNKHYISCIKPKPLKKIRGIDFDPNSGYANGTRKAWNKGLLTKSNPRIPDNIIFVKDSSTTRNVIRKRVLKNKLISYICAICLIEDIWNGTSLSLHLDHINGIYNDHRLENLRFLCPNCHSQTKTYAGRNKKYKRD